MNNMTYDEIKPYIDIKLVSEQEHPENPDLRIFNYTQHCQFEKEWNPVTKQCRGFIMNVVTGEIIARPFPKFFNYEEHVANGDMIPGETPDVYTKLDGSLGILYWLNGEPQIATRGSFSSDQAKWATAFVQKPDVRVWTEKMDRTKTHLFEIIYPENRIVINYNFSGLVHLATIDTQTGKSEPIDSDFPMVSKIPFTSFEELKNMNLENEEGFVLHYPKTDFRMKIKFQEYVRLHKIVTGLSAIGIWESLSEGQEIKLEDVPDEFFKWYNSVKDDLLDQFFRIEKASQELLQSLDGLESRKDKAIHIFKNSQRLSSIVFNMMDDRDYKKAIWRMVRPKGMSAFKKDIDA